MENQELVTVEEQEIENSAPSPEKSPEKPMRKRGRPPKPPQKPVDIDCKLQEFGSRLKDEWKREMEQDRIAKREEKLRLKSLIQKYGKKKNKKKRIVVTTSDESTEESEESDDSFARRPKRAKQVLPITSAAPIAPTHSKPTNPRKDFYKQSIFY